MSIFDPNAPVIIAVGEASRKTVPGDWPTPAMFAGKAIEEALTDSGRPAELAAIIDCVAAIRSFEDSGLRMGTGSPDNVPETYAIAGGVSAGHYVYADIGGQSPQALVNEFSAAVKNGKYRAVLIAGAEAIGTAKRARKAGVELDWRNPSDTPFDNRLSDFPILDRAEIRHGITSMPIAYSMIENARMAGHSGGHDAYMGELAILWSAFSHTSLGRDHAQFAKSWNPLSLLDDVDGNYQLTDIYRRWMVAQDGVDVGAALILTTAGTARDIGIADDRMIWLAGAAEAAELPISCRHNIAGSDALHYAVHAACKQAGITPDKLGPIDIYSCFPCAVFAGIDILQAGGRGYDGFSLTGGLTFFGGPGNGYSMHGIVAMTQVLRGGRAGATTGMITANGGVMSKQAVGIYMAHPPGTSWDGNIAYDYHPVPVARNDHPSGPGHILSMAQPVIKGVGGDVILLIEMDNGERALAILDGEYDEKLVGKQVIVTPGEKRHGARLV